MYSSQMFCLDVVDCVQDGIQLSNGGRVEVCNSDEWGSICSQDWDRNDAMVACRQLGFGATPCMLGLL